MPEIPLLIMLDNPLAAAWNSFTIPLTMLVLFAATDTWLVGSRSLTLHDMVAGEAPSLLSENTEETPVDNA